MRFTLVIPALDRHPGESRGLGRAFVTSCPEIPAFAGMTVNA
jgi:hypothetical protein